MTSASTAAPSTSPVEALTPEAMSVATTGRVGLVDRLDRARRGIARLAGEAGAEDRVDHHARAARARPAARRAPTSRAPSKRSRFARASSESSSGGASSSASTSKPVSRRARAATSPSPPLLPLPQTIAARLAARPRRRPPRRRGPPSPSARARARPAPRSPRRSVARISSASRQGSSQCLHRGQPTRRRAASTGERPATATAPAISRECVSEIAISAAAGQPPRRGRAAGPWAARRLTTSISRGGTPLPQRLDHGLLGGEARREVAARARPLARVGELALGEQPLGQPRPPLERALDALDLDQVDADAGATAAYLRPRTAFSSPWSPLLAGAA